MRIRFPTLRKIESTLKQYGLQAVGGLLASLGVFFQDWFVSNLVQVPSERLATAVVWLAIAAFVVLFVGAFYVLKSRTLEKAVLRLDPNFYDHHEFDNAFDEAARNP
jgi:hypothetical protein